MKYKKGETVLVWITGMLGSYEAIILEDADNEKDLRLQVGKFPTLKNGDFIICSYSLDG